MLGDGDPASAGRGVQEARQTLQAGQHAVFRLPGRCELRGDRQVGVSCAPGTTGKVRAGGGGPENEELGGEVEGGEEGSVTSKSRAKPWRRSSTLPPSPRQTLRDGWRSGGRVGEGRPHREGRGGEARGTPHAPGSQTPRSSIVHSTHQTCHCVAGCGWGNSRERGGGAPARMRAMPPLRTRKKRWSASLGCPSALRQGPQRSGVPSPPRFRPISETWGGARPITERAAVQLTQRVWGGAGRTARAAQPAAAGNRMAAISLRLLHKQGTA